jgi:hypothetical protein
MAFSRLPFVVMEATVAYYITYLLSADSVALQSQDAALNPPVSAQHLASGFREVSQD